MENIISTNSPNLTDIKMDNGESAISDKIKRAYELYESNRINDTIALIESDGKMMANSHCQLLLGNCYYQIQNEQKAITHWEKAIEISPLEYTAYINIGNELYKKDNINEAILNWQLACSIMPENPTVNLNLANAYNRLNNRIKATRFFEKYLKYEKNTNCTQFLKVKQTFGNLTAKVDFYAKKVEEYKLQRDLKTIAALCLIAKNNK